MQLEGKKVIVTGGGQGIGKGIAIAMAQAGADVLIQYRSAEKLAKDIASSIKAMGRESFVLQSDFSNADALHGFVDKAKEILGDIDILVNCAAAYVSKPFIEISLDEIRLMHMVNAEAPMILTQNFAKFCIANNKKGSVVNVASISGTMPSVNSLLNSCSKASLIMLTRSMALELAPKNIRVNAIAPGMVDTESNTSFKEGDPEGWANAIAEIPLGRVGDVKDCGELAVFLASDRASWITGVTVPVDGGMTVSWRS